MPNTVTQSRFATMCGVTRQSISKAKNEKPPAIKLFGKKVNLDHRITCEYFFKHTGKNLRPESVDDPPPVKADKPKPPKKPAKKKPKNTSTPIEEPEVNPDIDLDKLDYENGYTLPDGINCFEDITIHNLHKIPGDLVKKVKELEVAKKAKQDRDDKRGKLIERELVKKIFAKIHMVDTNQWKTLENKIMPEMCSILKFQDGSDQAIEARKMITVEVNKILKFTKRLIDEFFEKNKEEKGK